MKIRAYMLSLMLAASCVMSGCAGQGNAEVLSETLADTKGEEQVTQGEGSVATIAAGPSVMDTSEMFSDRDKEIGYDESDSVTITLQGDTASASSDKVTIDGSEITITEEGTYVVSGTLNDGSIVIETADDKKIQLVLNGASIASSDSAAIYVKESDKVFITTVAGTQNTLTNNGEYVQTDDNAVDGVIFSKADLTLNGEGALCITSEYGHGVVSKDDLVVTSGTYDITVSGHGLAGKDSVRIANGDFTLNVAQDAIHTSNSEDAEKGFVYIADGNFQIVAQDDAIHAESKLLIENGNINITECYEGLEAIAIDVVGGNINITASDDGLNAAGGNDQSGNETGWGMMDTNADAYVNIAGGVLYVNAEGDGLDSNGNLYVSGGEIYVVGPRNSGNGALDYAIDGQISGGTFVATGMSGMAMNFGSNSTQGSIMNTSSITLPAGSVIELTDSTGNVLLNYTTEKECNSVVISCPEIEKDQTYTLKMGDETTEIQMTDIIYGASHGMGGGQGGFGGGKGGFGGRGQGGQNGERPDMSQMPEGMQNGEMPELPEGMESGQMPEGMELPEGMEPGQMPEGMELPEGMQNGEMPQPPEGMEMPNGQMPQRPEQQSSTAQNTNA